MRSHNTTNTAGRLLLGAAFLAVGMFMSSGAAATENYNGPHISFEQVFANPVDNELKLNYARQQAAAGDLLSAAGFLEGMLFAQPNWDSARLFYAIVLFQLDDPNGASREFALLKNRPLTSEQRRLANYFTDQLDTPNKSRKNKNDDGVKISGYAEAGIRSDSNASNSLFESTFIAANSSDTSSFANGALKVSIPVLGDNLRFNLGLKGQTQHFSTFSQSDFDVLGVAAGFSGELGAIDFAADFKADNVYILGEKYLSQMGPQISLGGKITDNTYLRLMGSAYYQDYEDTQFSPNGGFRSGGKFLVNASLFSRPSAAFSYGASVGYESKIATTQFLRYKGFRLGAHIRNEFDNGVYVKANAGVRFLNYGAPNLFVVPAITREDDIYTGYAGLGASFNTIGSWMGIFNDAEMENFYFETAITYSNLSSNIGIFDYENTGVLLKMLWDF